MKQFYIKHINKLTVKTFFLLSLQCYFLLLPPNSHRTKVLKIISLFLPQKAYRPRGISQEWLPISTLSLTASRDPIFIFCCWCHRDLSLGKHTPCPSPQHPTYRTHISNQLPFPTAIFLLINIKSLYLIITILSLLLLIISSHPDSKLQKASFLPDSLNLQC